MTLNEIKDILKGDFSNITLEEGETHATVFAKAFNHAIKCVELLESLSTDNMNLPEIIDGSTCFRIVDNWIEALSKSNLEGGLEQHTLIVCARALHIANTISNVQDYLKGIDWSVNHDI